MKNLYFVKNYPGSGCRLRQWSHAEGGHRRREGAERVNDEEAERSGMAELPAITPQRSEDVSASSRF